MAKRRRKSTKRGRRIEQVVTTRDRIVFDGRNPWAPRDEQGRVLRGRARQEEYERRMGVEHEQRDRASFTPTPVTHASPTRPFYRRGNRPLFEQEKPLMLQSYGSSPDEHTREGDEAIDRARDAAVKGANLADEGNCRGARVFLNAAHTAVGAAVAHSRSGGTVRDITVTTVTVNRAEAYYEKRCKVRRK